MASHLYPESLHALTLGLSAAACALTQLLLALYGLHPFAMVWLFARPRRGRPVPPDPPREWPAVTVQLPVHNELYVVDRLIDAACSLDYPRDRLEVQVLDDSTDETSTLAAAAAERWRFRGVEVRVLHRQHRCGFKAGALEEGLHRARGELIAVFDADFVPPRDFLRRLVPHFGDPRVGMVQARWGHLNRDFSWLTRAQGMFLDAHFLVEHSARSGAGLFFNFNGTAGMWRRRCIEDAGGWHHDTLTEDLDLSYRAQLRGWRFVFLPRVVAPAELPADMNAFKSQQRRWVKGSIQTARKMLPPLWHSGLPWALKLEASYHLTGNVAYLALLASALLMLPVMALMPTPGGRPVFALCAALFATGMTGACVYLLSGQRAQGRGLLSSLRLLPVVLALAVGLSLNNARAVLEALLPRVGYWERTPKYALEPRTRRRGPPGYRAGGRLSGVGELAAAGYFLLTAVYAWRHDFGAVLPFLTLLLAGFGYVGWGSMRPGWARVAREAGAGGCGAGATGARSSSTSCP
jgi:hypothetical protein